MLFSHRNLLISLVRMKNGRVVVVLRGRFAGRKAIVVKATDKVEGSGRNFGRALVAGIDKYPRRTLMKHTKKQISKRLCTTAFLKEINYNHLFPTRYHFDQDLSTIKGMNEHTDPARKRGLRLRLRKIFNEKYVFFAVPFIFFCSL
jgi:large subunit ribosomal protein L27e